MWIRPSASSSALISSSGPSTFSAAIASRVSPISSSLTPSSRPPASSSASPPSWLFQGQGLVLSPTRPFCLEICAGSGRLTSVLRQAGLDAWGIDHKHAKIVPETAAMITLDLSDAKDIKKLWHLIDHPLLVFVHMAPPCGTCSRARDRAARDLPGGGPPPLRSNDFPEGFPDLAVRLPDQHTRVSIANGIYRLLVDIALFLIERQIPWALENPLNSLLWLISFVLSLISLPVVGKVTFQHCMFGGTRPKSTAFHFFPLTLFDDLHQMCDGSHSHDPWGMTSSGKFSTALETVYPQGLCEAVRDCLLRHLHLQRLPPLPVRRSRGDAVPLPFRDERAAAGLQPRGGRARRLLPEFRRTLWIPGSFKPSDPRCQIGFIWEACVIDCIVVPKGAKTISTSATSSSTSSSFSPSSSWFQGV